MSDDRNFPQDWMTADSEIGIKSCLCGKDACIGASNLRPLYHCIRELGEAAIAKLVAPVADAGAKRPTSLHTLKLYSGPLDIGRNEPMLVAKDADAYMDSLERQLKIATDRLLQRERDLDQMRCQLMDANAKIADLEHQIRVISINSDDNYAAAENRVHKAEVARDQALIDKDEWRQLSKEFQERLWEVKAERDELSEKVTALIAQLTPLIIPEAK